MKPVDPLQGLSMRLPPHNQAVEQAVLGAILANSKSYERVAEFLQAEHFADPIHAMIFRSIVRRLEAGEPADPRSLAGEFSNNEEMARDVGGTAYLAHLFRAMVGYDIGPYGRLIHDCWVRRQLIDVGAAIVEAAFDPPAPRDETLPGRAQIETAEQALFDLASSGGEEKGAVTFDAALDEAIAMAEVAYSRGSGISGLPMGLRDIDQKTGGMHPSDLLILAGRPGMGKTALAMKIAMGAARAIHAGTQPAGLVAIFSLEMSADQLANRILAEEARVSADRIRRGEVQQHDFDRFVQVKRELKGLPMRLDDQPAITLSALRTRCRRMKRTKGLSLVVIDYLQLMRPSAGTKPDGRVQEISQITQGLKAIAKELEVPVLALSQLSRAVESREDKRPQLSDLRESGTIEQDADAVMFVYRDDYYLAQRKPKQEAFENVDKFNAAMDKWTADMDRVANVAELIIAKQRHGPTGMISLFFEGEFTRFADLDRAHNER